MYCIEGFVLLSLLGTSLSLPLMYMLQHNACEANVTENSYGTILQGCPVPPIMFGGYSSPPSIETVVTAPATIDDVVVTWFLNDDGRPSLNISVEAQSPNSAQEYTITVMADYFPLPVYCGRISTRRPSSDVPQSQTISVQLNCLENTLTPSKGGSVIVDAKGAPQGDYTEKKFRLPSCKDSEMYNSNECTAERKKRIQFTLSQRGNSVEVVLRTTTAYQSNERVNVAIAKRNTDSMLFPWTAIGNAKTLTDPERVTTFTNLEIGPVYLVTVWRPTETDKRYGEKIALKHDVKVKSSQDFMRRVIGNKR